MANLAEGAALLGGIANVAGVAGGGNNNNEEDQAAQLQEEQANQAAAGPFACFVWLCAGSTSLANRCEFIGWIILGLLAVIFYGVYLNQDSEGAELNWGYFLCCGLSLLLTAYASCNFSNILDLKRVVDNLVQSTLQLTQIRGQIQEEIGNLKTVRDTLAQIEEEQSIANAQLRTQEKQFREWTSKSFKRADEADTESKKIKKELQLSIENEVRQIKRSERGILYNALQALQKIDDDQSGLNISEYEIFRQRIPLRYKTRISVKDFFEWSDNDENIDWKDFQKILNEIVSQETQDLANGIGVTIPGIRDGIPDPIEEPTSDQDDEKNS